MSYNPSTGVYSLPAIYLAIPGTVIIAAQHNTPLEDLATANNYARPVIAGGTGANTKIGAADSLEVVSFGSAQVLTGSQKLRLRTNAGESLQTFSTSQLVDVEDVGKTLQFTATATVTFSAAADLGADFSCELWANYGVTLTLDPNGSETINGASSLVIRGGSRVVVWSNGTALFAKITGDVYSGPQLQGHIYGLTLSNNATDATNDIDIAAGSAGSDGTTPVLMTLSSALTKRLDAAWAVGSGNGGLDTGTIANATYYMWLIRRSDTGVVDALFSLSRTSPTMPTNYDQKAYIGAIVRSGATITPFKQIGRHFYLVTPRQEFDSTGTGSYVNLTINAPPNTIARVVANINSGSNYFVAILPTDTSAPSSLSATGWNMMSGVGPSYDGGEYLVPTDSAAQIKHAATSGAAYRIYLMGWEDPGLKI